MVKAADPTDAVINEAAEAMEPGDIIIDRGKALYTEPSAARRPDDWAEVDFVVWRFPDVHLTLHHA